ncbi:VWA domain-containing protein [uncultured Microbacterium sp.]|uniref:VWA domain-containing protein n=1 Tax=uncultured Microbacterium sp. TaxID=191216 RepID=UPI002631DF26|nr:VWA domain-containing protein [uncultured Microbacterium sp.]
MIFQPVLNVFLLILLFTPVLALTVWLLVRAIRTPAPGAAGPLMWALRIVMLLAAFGMLLRPGIPGGTSQTLATDTDIIIVLDTTASIAAEDWNGSEQRLEGVRADVQSIVEEYPGARFSLITFDASAQQRLPLTTDTTALISAVEIVRPEVTVQSKGSSISIASTMLQDVLSAAAESAPDRSRMVFYLGDGEQTISDEPDSFSGSAAYVDGGAVFGYGTSDGGPMRITTGSFDAADGGVEYIEYQGQQALSVVDDANLQAIGADLGIPYLLRSADTAIELPEAPTTTTDYAASGEVGNIIELYWIFALVIIAALGIEIARATVLLARMRGEAIHGGAR